MFKILIVEDDSELRDLFCAVLRGHGYSSIPATDGVDAMEVLEKNHVDLVITDVMMPRMDGVSFVRELREAGDTVPILIVTAKGGATDKQAGFRAGADDYMVKPVDVNEVVWRVEALLRRSQINNQRKVKIGDTVLSRDALMVSGISGAVELPPKEFYLLYKLAASPGRIFTRDQIMQEIWGPDSDTDVHTLDVHISRLREKFKNNPDFEIVTVRGVGYKAVRK